ncbi:MAG: FMN-binding protein [Actinobacteria bacterium]|nr:FMN-binding protein [Actinomycetota bacterium]
MPRFLRSAAPALFVGTAAVLVVGAADNGLAGVVGAAAPTSTGGADSTSENSGAAPWDRLEQLLDDHDDDDHDGDDRDGDDNEEDYAAGGVPAVGDVPGQAGTGSGMSGSSGGACSAAEVTGPVVRTEWGPVQVAAQVANGRVCGIRTLTTPDGDRKSVMINARAVPALEQQVLAAGDASFQGVSGATVTTEGYRSSLQAILDGA